MRVKDRLNQYRWIVKTIEEMENRLLEIDAKLEKVTTRLKHDVVQASMQADKWGDLISLKCEIQDKINDRLRDSYTEMRYIENMISVLPERERLMMVYKYIDGKTWEEVAVAMNYTRRHMHKIHSECLIKLKHDIE